MVSSTLRSFDNGTRRYCGYGKYIRHWLSARTSLHFSYFFTSAWSRLSSLSFFPWLVSHSLRARSHSFFVLERAAVVTRLSVKRFSTATNFLFSISSWYACSLLILSIIFLHFFCTAFLILSLASFVNFLSFLFFAKRFTGRLRVFYLRVTWFFFAQVSLQLFYLRACTTLYFCLLS